MTEDRGLVSEGSETAGEIIEPGKGEGRESRRAEVRAAAAGLP